MSITRPSEKKFVAELMSRLGYGQHLNAPPPKAEDVLAQLYRYITPAIAGDLLEEVDAGTPRPGRGWVGPRGSWINVMLLTSVTDLMLYGAEEDGMKGLERALLDSEMKQSLTVAEFEAEDVVSRYMWDESISLEQKESALKNLMSAHREFQEYENQKIQYALDHGLPYTTALKETAKRHNMSFDAVRKRIERLKSPQLAELKKAIKNARLQRGDKSS